MKTNYFQTMKSQLIIQRRLRDTLLVKISNKTKIHINQGGTPLSKPHPQNQGRFVVHIGRAHQTVIRVGMQMRAISEGIENETDPDPLTEIVTLTWTTMIVLTVKEERERSPELATITLVQEEKIKINESFIQVLATVAMENMTGITPLRQAQVTDPTTTNTEATVGHVMVATAHLRISNHRDILATDVGVVSIAIAEDFHQTRPAQELPQMRSSRERSKGCLCCLLQKSLSCRTWISLLTPRLQTGTSKT